MRRGLTDSTSLGAGSSFAATSVPACPILTVHHDGMLHPTRVAAVFFDSPPWRCRTLFYFCGGGPPKLGFRATHRWLSPEAGLLEGICHPAASIQSLPPFERSSTVLHRFFAHPPITCGRFARLALTLHRTRRNTPMRLAPLFVATITEAKGPRDHERPLKAALGLAHTAKSTVFLARSSLAPRH